MTALCVVCRASCSPSEFCCSPRCSREWVRQRRIARMPRCTAVRYLPPRVSDALRETRAAVAQLLERGRVARNATRLENVTRC